MSDDGDDTDGNTTNDPTETSITASPSLKAVKIAQVTDNGDGITGVGDVINYSITVKNTGNITLNNVSITDTLKDGSGNILNLSNGPTYGGSSMNSINGILKPNEIATYNAYLIVNQNYVDTGLVSNTVTANASTTGNSNISDVSDNGNDADGNTVDDETITRFDMIPSLEVTKTATVIDINGNSLNDLGDKILYTIQTLNNGNVAVKNLTLEDQLSNSNNTVLTYTQPLTFKSNSFGSSVGNLKVNEISTYTATYTITQADVDAGKVLNSVTARASDPLNSSGASDKSDDGDDTDGNTTDDPTEIILAQNPKLEVTKTANVVDVNNSNSNDQGDKIVYTITVANTGSVTLSGITLNDTLTDGDGLTLSLNSGPTFNSATQGSNQTRLLVGEVATYTATYTISLQAANSGSVNNTLQATASSPNNNNNVTDVSDDGDDTDGNTTNDPTIVLTVSQGAVEVTKTATVSDTDGNNTNSVGDIINYTITVENKGGQTITGVSLVDTLTDNNGVSLNLTAGPVFVSSTAGSSQGTLTAGETATYTATFIIDLASKNSGAIVNRVTVTASSPGSTGDLTDVSDDGDDTDGNTTNDPTIVYTSLIPSIEVTKIANVVDNGDGINGAGDTINYTITVINTGNVNISGLSLVDTLTDGNNGALTLTSNPTFTSNSLGSNQGTLVIGETSTYSASYLISNAAALTSKINNTVTATGSSPGNTNDVSDISDDGDDTDGNTTNDPTEVIIAPSKVIEVTKRATVSDNGDGVNGAGDTINYVITIENKGNVQITGLTLNDIITDGNGTNLTLTTTPTFVSNSNGSPQGTIAPNEISTYNATYLVTQANADTGSVNNTVTVTGSSPGNTNDVSDVSDDGDDTDGNTTNDATVVEFNLNSSIEVTKTAYVIDNGDGTTNSGDTIVYTITVNNNGNTAVSSITLVDNLKDGNNRTLQLSSGPTFVSSTQNSLNGSLIVGETATYSATYLITDSDSATGKVVNSVTVTGSSPGNTNNVSDVSDDGDDTDGNTSNDPTEIEIQSIPAIEVTKTATITDSNNNGINDTSDTISYTITVENKGNIVVSGLSYVDKLTDGNGKDLVLTTPPTFVSSSQGSVNGIILPGETATYVANYIIGQRASDTGVIRNSIVFTGNSPGKIGDVTDISDDGDDTDGNTNDDQTEIFTVSNVGLEVTKTAKVTDNGDNKIGAGDIVEYTITVENKGNSSLSDIILVDTLTDGEGNSLSLSNGPFFSGASEQSGEGILVGGETATYIAFYIIEEKVIPTGKIINTAEVSATGPNLNYRISDISDDGDDTDGNIVDDPTIVLLEESPMIEVTKTATVSSEDQIIDSGDLITYTITVENTGNTPLKNLIIEDNLSDALGNTLKLSNGPFFTGADKGSTEGNLKIGETATYIAFYSIETQAAETGIIINSVSASAENLDGTKQISDISDDGDDTDGNVEDDPTEIHITPRPELEVTKTASVTSRDEFIGAGDVITYTISIRNTGNVKINDLTIEDTMYDGNGGRIYLTTNPYFVSSTLGSDQNSILPGGLVIYEAIYNITQADAYTGFIENIVQVSGTVPDYNLPIFDISDDGDDDDGNTTDDPTVTELDNQFESKIEVFTLVTPNNDGKNDILYIRGIEDYPNNLLRIYNRWGVLVFEVKNYPGRVNSDAFNGFSRGRITIDQNVELPSGTYYYVLTFPEDDNPGKTEYVGYLFLYHD